MPRLSQMVTFGRDIHGINNFSVAINTVNFVPDEVIVRSVGLYPSADIYFHIYSDLVATTMFFIGSDASNVTTMPNVSFVPRGGNGTWNFSILNESDQQVLAPNVTILYIQLEFIKH